MTSYEQMIQDMQDAYQSGEVSQEELEQYIDNNYSGDVRNDIYQDMITN